MRIRRMDLAMFAFIKPICFRNNSLISGFNFSFCIFDVLKEIALDISLQIEKLYAFKTLENVTAR
jgi:hypothetical protein